MLLYYSIINFKKVYLLIISIKNYTTYYALLENRGRQSRRRWVNHHYIIDNITEHIFCAWKNSEDALGIFCDLFKAFDCVHHDTLIRKLQYYGMKNSALTYYFKKRAIRTIYNLKPRESLREKFKKVAILTLASVYLRKFYLCSQKQKYFCKKSNIHSVNTRNKNKLVIPVSRLHRVTNRFMG